MRDRVIPSLCLVGAALLLSACGGSEQDDIRAWMQTERNSIKPSVKPIPEPTKFEPQAYSVEQQLPPFSAEKLASVLRGSRPGFPATTLGL